MIRQGGITAHAQSSIAPAQEPRRRIPEPIFNFHIRGLQYDPPVEEGSCTGAVMPLLVLVVPPVVRYINDSHHSDFAIVRFGK